MNPGSEMAGVPASETRAIFSPPLIRAAICSTVLCSLNLWWDCILFCISKCFSKMPVVRVSSAKIRSASFSTRIARNVISSKLPTGVGFRSEIALFIFSSFPPNNSLLKRKRSFKLNALRKSERFFFSNISFSEILDLSANIVLCGISISFKGIVSCTIFSSGITFSTIGSTTIGSSTTGSCTCTTSIVGDTSGAGCTSGICKGLLTGIESISRWCSSICLRKASNWNSSSVWSSFNTLWVNWKVWLKKEAG